MASNESGDIRSRTTRGIIDQTFRAMVCELPENKINVKSIADRAHINRKTFYLHYRCIEDLYRGICTEISDGYEEKHNALNPKKPDRLSPEENAERYYRTFFEYFTQLDSCAERILCGQSYRFWANEVIDACAASTRTCENNMLDLTPDERKLFHSPFVRSMVDVYRQWVHIGKTVSVDTLTSYAMKVLYRGMSSLVY